ncbi:hypothetical protein SLS53_000577 [Cytospora paraplurivora]|uniref:Uncharacterized protein n=1 Tax=Cytospora paraplurivora TaxID=2898453 RepID=A0AAN9UKF2_9PEZI
MESLAPKPSGLDLHHRHGTFTPPPLKRILPLRIMKRPDSCCDLRRHNADDRSPRTCSQETDESCGSAPEPPDGEQQLTIPKIRGSRSSRVFGGLDDVDEDPVPLGREPYVAKDEVEALSILVPDVRVTPDTKFVDYGYHNFWVAIEIEGKGDCGFLYDIKVDVEATTHSSVLEVIENYSAPSTLAHGSRLLVLANVELRLPNYSRLMGHVRSHSDELMEDLEHQLGSAACDYLRVNLVYQHTAFPSKPDPDVDPPDPDDFSSNTDTGVTESQTKLRSTFTASITRHDSASPWSPPPAHAPAPAPSRLAGIGLHAADELLQTKLARRNTAAPRRTTYLARPGGAGGGPGNHDRSDSYIDRYNSNNKNYNSIVSSPTRRGREPAMSSSSSSSSLRRGAARLVVDENEREREGQGQGQGQGQRRRGGGCDDDDDVDDDGGGVDTAPRIWARLRRCSGMSGSNSNNKGNKDGDSGDYRGATVSGGDGGSKASLTNVTNHQTAGFVGEMLDRRRGGMIRKGSGGGGKGRRVGSSERWGFGNWWAS